MSSSANIVATPSSSVSAPSVPQPEKANQTAVGSTGDGARERACPPAASTTKVSDRQQDKMPSQSAIAGMEASLLKSHADMTLSQKLVKALCLAHLGLHRSVELHSRSHDVSDGDLSDSDEEEEEEEEDFGLPQPSTLRARPRVRARALGRGGQRQQQSQKLHAPNQCDVALSGMQTSDYSLLIETLASALKDASDQDSEEFQEDAEEDVEEEQEEEIIEVVPVSTPVLPADSSGAPEPQDVPLPPSPKLEPKPLRPTARHINSSVFKSLNELITLIKPDQTAAEDEASTTLDDESDTAADAEDNAGSASTSVPPAASGPSPPCHLTRLPTETLTRIFSLARRQQDATACECGSNGCAAGKAHYQRQALQLRFLCKKLLPATTAVALGVVRLRSRTQISALVRVLQPDSSEDEARASDLAACIKHLEVKVPALALPFMSNSASASSLFGSRGSRNRSSAFPWLQTPDSPSGATASDAVSASSSSPSSSAAPQAPASEHPIAPLVKLAPALSSFDLSVSRSTSYSYSAWSMLSDFLEIGLQEALSGCPALKSLTFKQCVDYGELEQILLDCPSITDLRLEGGLDNLDSRDEVADRPHQCKLRSFYLNNWESVELGERQLCWLLAPSAGYLTSLEVATSVSLNAGGIGGGNGFPPFAGADFASLLVKLGPTLTRLALKDSLGQGIGGLLATQINPTLRAQPHDGVLDHALKHCTSLRELAVEWTLTGSKFLSAIEQAPLFSLVLLGSPQHTPASDMIQQLRTSFKSLRYLNLICFGTQAHQAQAWTARDVRALRKACTDRKLEFVFSASI